MMLRKDLMQAWGQKMLRKDLKNYKTKKIDYTGCDPVIKKALKKGLGIFCRVGDVMGDTLKEEYIVAYFRVKGTYGAYCYQAGFMFYKNAVPIKNIAPCEQLC